MKLASYSKAPGKIIIAGEHFVVHGSRSLAAAIDKGILVKINKSDKHEIYSNYGDRFIQIEKNTNQPISDLAKRTLDFIGVDESLKITIDSDIPNSSGLGSSSAVMVATVSAIGEFFNVNLTKTDIYNLAMSGEKSIHGNPSGVDVAASVYGGIISFRKGENPTPVKMNSDLELIVIVSGIKRKTSILINKFTKVKSLSPNLFEAMLKSSDILIGEMQDALVSHNLQKIGALMNFYNSCLSYYGLDHVTTDELIDKSLSLGCYGSKITGAGGGGSVIAIAEKTKTSLITKQINQYGYECFSIKLPQEGVKCWTD